MIFGPVPLARAAGCILAHTHRLPDRTVIKKGTRLDDRSVAALQAAGRDIVIAAQLEPGDVGEDEAAASLAEALLTPSLGRSRAGTGRVNLVAERAGLLRVDPAGIDALNAADESLTLATLPDWASVTPGEMVATVKVIPFAVPGPALARARQAASAGLLRLHPYTPHRVGLVMTTLPGLKPSILAGTEEATAARIAGLGGSMLPARTTPHESAAIAQALRELAGEGAEILLVAGASAVVDRRDIGPMGIVEAGGLIRHFGMPVDPGNLICLGQLGGRPALVLPGCARSPKLNGIDWVLQRLFAGLDVDGASVSGMGVGGLLKDTGPRPLPRAKATAPQPVRPATRPASHAVARATSGIALVVLAAGASRRMAPDHKLLLDAGGKPMLARTVDNLLSSPMRPILVVTGHREAEIGAAIAGRPVDLVHAPDHGHGLSASLRAGLAAVPEECRAAIVVLGDMPLVTARVLGRLADAYDPDEGRLIVAPTHAGTLGNPVLWDRRFFPEMMALTGDRGARPLLERHAEHLATVPMDDDAVLQDADTAEQWATIRPRLRP